MSLGTLRVARHSIQYWNKDLNINKWVNLYDIGDEPNLRRGWFNWGNLGKADAKGAAGGAISGGITGGLAGAGIGALGGAIGSSAVEALWQILTH